VGGFFFRVHTMATGAAPNFGCISVYRQGHDNNGFGTTSFLSIFERTLELRSIERPRH
jgi:hypothetical protein